MIQVVCGLYKGMQAPSRKVATGLPDWADGARCGARGGLRAGPSADNGSPRGRRCGCVGRVWWRVAVQAVLGLYEGLHGLISQLSPDGADGARRGARRGEDRGLGPRRGFYAIF